MPRGFAPWVFVQWVFVQWVFVQWAKVIRGSQYPVGVKRDVPSDSSEARRFLPRGLGSKGGSVSLVGVTGLAPLVSGRVTGVSRGAAPL